MNLSFAMRALCDNIASASANRAHRLDSLWHETAALKRDTRRRVNGFHESFGAMSRGLRSGLQNENAARKKAVARLCAEFRKDNRAVRSDLAAAKRIWAALTRG